MVQTEISVRKRHTYRRRHRRSRLCWLVRSLFPMSIFLFAAAVCITAFVPAEDQRDGPSEVDVSVSSKPIQNSPLQNVPEPSGPVAEDTWKLLLVNPWNSLPEDYSIQTVTLKNGLRVDERCYPDLQAMMDACRADGLSPVICSAYRTQEYQERLYQAEVERWLARGYSQDSAKTEAGKSVAIPGTSEHQLDSVYMS